MKICFFKCNQINSYSDCKKCPIKLQQDQTTKALFPTGAFFLQTVPAWLYGNI